MKTTLETPAAQQIAAKVIAKMRRAYDGGRFRESELESVAVHMGYRRADPQISGVEWLASKFATAGEHPGMPAAMSDPDGPRLTFKNGDVVPAQSAASYVCATANRILAA